MPRAKIEGAKNAHFSGIFPQELADNLKKLAYVKATSTNSLVCKVLTDFVNRNKKDLQTYADMQEVAKKNTKSRSKKTTTTNSEE